MLSERVVQSLRDILKAIEFIREWVAEAGGVERAVNGGEMIRSAIERQLLIISEAAIRIDHVEPDFGAKHAPEIEWNGVRGIGNVIRHRYDEIESKIIDHVLRHELDGLQAACSRILASV